MINLKMTIDSEIEEFYDYKIVSNARTIDNTKGEFLLISEKQEIEIHLEGIFWSNNKSILWTILYGLFSVIIGMGDSYASTLRPYNYYYKFSIPEDEKNIYININQDMNLVAYNTKKQKIKVDKNKICKKSYLNRWGLFISLPILLLTMINILIARVSYYSTSKGILNVFLVIGIVGELIWSIYNYTIYREARRVLDKD